MGERRGAYRVLVGKPERYITLRRPRRRWEDNIKMDLQKVGLGSINWNDLALVAGSCKCDNEPSGCVQCREFLD
jgi:hypothetical protein